MAEVKNEDRIVCRCCLSADRKMKVIGNYADIFCRIMQHNPATASAVHITDTLCWECYALLKKVVRFQTKVENAHSILQLADMQYVNYNVTTLSNLTAKSWTDQSDENYFRYDHDEIVEDSKMYLQIKDEAIDIKYEDITFGGFDSPSPLPLTQSEDCLTNNMPSVKQETLSTSQVSMRNFTKKSTKVKVEDTMISSYRKIMLTKLNKNDITLYTRVNIKDDTELHEWINQVKQHSRFKQANHKCETCIISFFSINALQHHNKIHHHRDCGRLLCHICSQRFKRKINLDKHVQQHMVKFKCNVCGHLALTRAFLYLHVKTCHTRIFECIKCGCKCWTRKEFFSHYKSMHKKFICDYCGKTFNERCKIINHIRKHHSDYKCEACKKNFKTYRIMNEHRKMYHEVGPTDDAYCVECNMRFNNVLLFKRHLTSSVKHNPPKKMSFACPVCEKVYSKKCTMNYHYKYVHKQESSFKCDQCNRSFLNGFRLRQHRQSIHDKVQRPRNKICTMCGRGFSTNRILINHIRTHTGERPHACPYCTATFAQKTAMTVHVRNIHMNKEKKPFAF